MPFFDKHAKYRARFAAFVDDELSPAEVGWVNTHIEACLRCAIEIEEMLEMSAALKAMPEAEPRRSFALTPEMLAEPAKPAPPPPMPRLQVGMRLASAAIALALVVVFVADNGLGGSNDAQPTSDGPASVEAGTAGDMAPTTSEGLGMFGEPEPISEGAAGGGPGGGGGSGQSADGGSGDTDTQFTDPTSVAEDQSLRDGEPAEATEVPPAVGALETTSDGGDDKAAEDSAGSTLAASETNGGLDAVLVAELVLLAALAGTVGASIFLAVRSRRA